MGNVPCDALSVDNGHPWPPPPILPSSLRPPPLSLFLYFSISLFLYFSISLFICFQLFLFSTGFPLFVWFSFGRIPRSCLGPGYATAGRLTRGWSRGGFQRIGLCHPENRVPEWGWWGSASGWVGPPAETVGLRNPVIQDARVGFLFFCVQGCLIEIDDGVAGCVTVLGWC